MKKMLFFAFGLTYLSVISCTRDSNESKPANASLTLESSKKFNTTAEGYVFITLDEYFDQPVTLTSATFSAEFTKNGHLTNVGSVQINGNLLKKSNENNYLLNNGINADELLNSSINVKINSKNNDFPDISSDIKTTSNLGVKTNIGLEGTFNKNQDLLIKWTPASISSDVSLRSGGTVYLGIAATGSALISREVPDNGQLTISASELTGLSPNAQAVIRLGRVTQQCTTQNGTTVCVDVLNSASSGPLVVQ